MPNQRGFTPVVLILIVLAVLAGLYLVLGQGLLSKVYPSASSNTSNPGEDYQNPFKEEASYENPFGTSSAEESGDYQNPFDF